ncbi:hypothetical protein HanXRQr2_Chr15g0706271 [Helianthus annuus]|uniref:Uncharacterized protein n=1 Tax=Helianthus annuus TaxID=4232 RepID=A0A9K3E415_HELAN|nr:hypothetical protein HanXRQr2_Chr15g0706271 [Helianthus annuus]KAJ0832360.1 hypothetical protein HanPSC8_Chr15g0677911 [Helianthus annuus]
MQPKSSPSQIIVLKLPPKKNNIEMPWIINNKPHSYSCEMIGEKRCRGYRPSLALDVISAIHR